MELDIETTVRSMKAGKFAGGLFLLFGVIGAIQRFFLTMDIFEFVGALGGVFLWAVLIGGVVFLIARGVELVCESILRAVRSTFARFS